MKRFFFPILFLFVTCNSEPENVDILITGGIIQDGTGNKGYLGNVAIKNDTTGDEWWSFNKGENFYTYTQNQAVTKFIMSGCNFVNMKNTGTSSLKTLRSGSGPPY